MKTVKGFIFDYSKCVGCHACVVACHLENSISPVIGWRHVEHFNSEKLPLAGFVNLSIACNHCKDAPCIKACPANAYYIHEATGAVVHNPEKCIGCKYCIWACPFSAPQYNYEEGIIEKCHFCHERLEEGSIPACTNSCPTGALSFGDIEEKPSIETIGLTSKPIYPRLKVIKDSSFHSVPKTDIEASGVLAKDIKYLNEVKSDFQNALSEWPLVLFSFLGTILVGWALAISIEPKVTQSLWVFGIIGLIAMALSTFHLGKPFRAYLSINNLKSSWLSREILLFGTFMLSGIIASISQISLIWNITTLLGFLFLGTLEMLYLSVQKEKKSIINSANTVITAIALASLISASWTILISMLALKAMLFTVNAYRKKFTKSPYIALVSFFRLLIGFLVPFIMLTVVDYQIFWLLAIAVILGELIDRLIFYIEFEHEVPFDQSNISKQMVNYR